MVMVHLLWKGNGGVTSSVNVTTRTVCLCTTNPQCPWVFNNMWSIWDFGNDILWHV